MRVAHPYEWVSSPTLMMVQQMRWCHPPPRSPSITFLSALKLYECHVWLFCVQRVCVYACMRVCACMYLLRETAPLPVEGYDVATVPPTGTAVDQTPLKQAQTGWKILFRGNKNEHCPFFVKLQEMLGELFTPIETPEAQNRGFLKGFFGGNANTFDREELCASFWFFFH